MSTKFEDLILRDTTANRPAASVPGRLFYDTTLEKWERDTGAAWEDCEPAGGGMDNPMTTAGDIIIGGVSGAPARLGIGDDDDVLTLTSGVPTWAPAAAAGGGADILEVQVFS